MFKNNVLLIIPLLIISLFYNLLWEYDWAIQFYPLIFQASTSLTFLYIVLLKWKDLPSLHVNKIDYLISIYYLYSIIISIYNNGNIKFDIEIAMLFSYLLLYCSIRVLIVTDKDNILLYIILLLLAASNCVIGALQFFGMLRVESSSYYLTGTFLNPGPFGGYLCFMTPICLYFVLVLKKRKQQFVSIIVFIIICTCIILSQSRTAILSSIIVLVTLLVYYFWSRIRVFRHAILISSTIFILAGSFYLYKLRPASANGRLLIWKITITMFDNSVIFGKGVGYFNDEYNLYQSKYFCNSKADLNEKMLAGYVHSPFNDFLKILIEFGIIGLVLFCLMLCAVFNNLRKTKVDLLSIANGCCFLSLLIFAGYSYPMQITALHTLFIISIALCARKSKVTIIKNNHLYHPIRKVAIIVNFIYLFLIYTCYQDVSKWRSANKSISYNLAYALKSYDQVYPNLINSYTFLYNYGSELVELGYYRKAILIFEQLNQSHHDRHLYSQMGRCYESMRSFKLAEHCYQVASCMEPLLLKPQMLLFEMFKASGQQNKAIIQANKILNTPVKIQTEEAEIIKRNIRLYLLEFNETIH